MTRRLAIFVAISGLAAVGATCKGKDPVPAIAPPVKKDVPPPPPVTEIEGLDLTGIDPTSRADAVRLLNEAVCYCGCVRTVAACLSNRAACSCVRCSERMADFILNEYRQGSSTEHVETHLLDGFSAGFNKSPVNFPPSEQPEKGTPGAPIVITEFADFRCPHCAQAFPMLAQLVSQRKDVLLRYYFFPLSGGGDRSLRAAEAAEEARVQGKFWEMAQVMFNNQLALEDADLTRYASEVGLNMAQFEAAMKSRKHQGKVNANKQAGEMAGVAFTPFLLINGRPLGFEPTPENINLRLDMEAERGRCD